MTAARCGRVRTVDAMRGPSSAKDGQAIRVVVSAVCKTTTTNTTSARRRPMTTAADVACNPEHVKSVVAAQVERALEWLFAVAESGGSTRRLEKDVWRAVLLIGAKLLSAALAVRCRRSLLDDLDRRGLSLADVTLRMGSDYWAGLTTTGPGWALRRPRDRRLDGRRAAPTARRRLRRVPLPRGPRVDPHPARQGRGRRERPRARLRRPRGGPSPATARQGGAPPGNLHQFRIRPIGEREPTNPLATGRFVFERA